MSRRSRHSRHPHPNTSTPFDRPGIATVPDVELPSEVAPLAPVVPLARPVAEPVAAVSVPAAAESAPAAAPVVPPLEGDAPRPTTCTQAQLRRFIKSRPWIPMHELRRRFGITGGDDDVTPVRTASGLIFVGLPPTEGRMLGELLTSGDVGYELSLDPGAPIVVGVYPMRPVPRG